MAFLDSTLNPNILLTVADERFHFIDAMLTDEALGMAANRTDTDVWLPKGGFCYDGRLLCDQEIETLCGGTWVCGGPRLCVRFMPARGTVFGTICVSVYPNGAYRSGGPFDGSGYAGVYAPTAMPDDGRYCKEEAGGEAV